MEKIIIIGGGPAGLSAAIYAARGMLNPLVIEGYPAGGQLLLTTEVENYPGFPNGITGPQLVQDMRKQAEKFGARFATENVLSVKKQPDHSFEIVTENGSHYTSQTVLVTTGANARWLGLESEKTFMGKGVSACATCDGFFFKGKDVAIVGGGDTAMEEALFLTKFAAKVYVIHRRDEFRASKIMQKRVLEHEKIEVLFNTEIEEILGDQAVNGLKVKTKNTDGIYKQKLLPVQGLFIAIGHDPATKFLKESGVEMDENSYIITNKHHTNAHYQYSTNIPGLFAAGDCVDPHYKQAATAVGMAVAAEIEIEKYLENQSNN
jgi:thioredoxin reductase (NADPH)